MLADRTRLDTGAETLASQRPKLTLPGHLRSFAVHQPLGAAAAAVLLIVVLVAIAAPVITPHGPLDIAVADRFTGPLGEKILGTDELGRDVFTRIIYGARVSMIVGLASVGIGITLGTLIGIFSAYVGGKVDLVVQRLVDAMMAFPAIILALALMAALGPSRPHNDASYPAQHSRHLYRTGHNQRGLCDSGGSSLELLGCWNLAGHRILGRNAESGRYPVHKCLRLAGRLARPGHCDSGLFGQPLGRLATGRHGSQTKGTVNESGPLYKDGWRRCPSARRH